MLKSALFAAVLAAALMISAMAAEMEPISQMQTKMRELLGFEGAAIPEYVEYRQGSDRTIDVEGILHVELISSLQDTDFIRFYIAVSPLTAEQAEAYVWYACPERIEGWTADYPVASLDKVYNENTRSLLLEVPMIIGVRIDLSKAEPATIMLIGGTEHEVLDYPDVIAFFSVTPRISEVSTVSIRFEDGIEFQNPETGEVGVLLGAEMNIGCISWLYTYDAADERFWTEGVIWANAIGGMIQNTVVNLSDGSSYNVPLTVAAKVEDSVVKETAYWGTPVILSAVESITVNGVTYPAYPEANHR